MAFVMSALSPAPKRLRLANERSLLFDYAKGIGIVLVVFGHVERGLISAGLPLGGEWAGLVDSVIYSFHMPLFFFVSGFFLSGSLSRHGGLGVLKAKVATVLYPYVLWSLIQGLTEVMLSRYTNGSVSFGQILSFPWQPRAQFWFLYALFGIYLFSVVAYRHTTAPWANGMLCLGLLLFISGFSPVDLYLFNSFSQWFVYFALGVSASVLACRAGGENIRRYVPHFSVIVFVAVEWVFHVVLELRADTAGPLAKLLVAIAGIAFVFALARLAMTHAWLGLSYVGRHSVEIYLLHIMAGSGVRIALNKFLGVSDAMVHLVAGTLAGVCVPLMIAHYAPTIGFGWLFSARALTPAISRHRPVDRSA